MAVWGLLTSFVLTVALVPVVRLAALRAGLVDQPNGRKLHRRPVPLLGGVALFAAAAATVLLFAGRSPQAGSLLLGGALFLAVGLLDDLRGLGAVKLLVEFAAATLVVLLAGTVFHLPWRWAEIALTVFWIVGVVNAFNCLDCADGAAASAALAAAGAFWAVAVLGGQRFEALLAAAILGAAAGFLVYNLHPARIFLGDAGSLTLGYLIAMLGVMLHPGTISVPAMAAPAVVLAVPIADIIYVHVRRFIQGQRSLIGLLTSTGKDHLPHRLLARGISPRRAAVSILLSGLACGTAGLALVTVNTLAGALVISAAVLLALLAAHRGMGRLPQAAPAVMRPSWQSTEGS